MHIGKFRIPGNNLLIVRYVFKVPGKRPCDLFGEASRSSSAFDSPLRCVLNLVKRGDIYTFTVPDLLLECPPVGRALEGVDKVVDETFGFSYHDYINEGRERLRIHKRTGASHQDERKACIPFGGV